MSNDRSEQNHHGNSFQLRSGINRRGRSDEKNGTDIRSNNHAGIERRELLLGGGALLAASAVTGGALVTSVPAVAQTAPKMKMTTAIPPEITTPTVSRRGLAR